MSTGCLITTDKENIIIKRKPIWPFPANRKPLQESYLDGTRVYFFPEPYYNFHLGEILNVTTS